MASLDESLQGLFPSNERYPQIMVTPRLKASAALPDGVMIPVMIAMSKDAYADGQEGLDARRRATFLDDAGNQYYLYHDPEIPGKFIALNQKEWEAQIWRGNDALGSDRKPVGIPVDDVWYRPDLTGWMDSFGGQPPTSADLGIKQKDNGDWVYEETGEAFPVEGWVHVDQNYLRFRVYEDGSTSQRPLEVRGEFGRREVGQFTREEIAASGLLVSAPNAPEPAAPAPVAGPEPEPADVPPAAAPVSEPAPVVEEEAPEVNVEQIINALRDLPEGGFDETPSEIDYRNATSYITDISRILDNDLPDRSYDRGDEVSSYVAAIHPAYREVVILSIEMRLKNPDQFNMSEYKDALKEISNGGDPSEVLNALNARILEPDSPPGVEVKLLNEDVVRVHTPEVEEDPLAPSELRGIDGIMRELSFPDPDMALLEREGPAALQGAVSRLIEAIRKGDVGANVDENGVSKQLNEVLKKVAAYNDSDPRLQKFAANYGPVIVKAFEFKQQNPEAGFLDFKQFQTQLNQVGEERRTGLLDNRPSPYRAVLPDDPDFKMKFLSQYAQEIMDGYAWRAKNPLPGQNPHHYLVDQYKALREAYPDEVVFKDENDEYIEAYQELKVMATKWAGVDPAQINAGPSVPPVGTPFSVKP